MKMTAKVLLLMITALDWTTFGVMVDGAEMEAENWRPLSKPQAPGVASPAHSCHTFLCAGPRVGGRQMGLVLRETCARKGSWADQADCPSCCGQEEQSLGMVVGRGHRS